MVEPKDDDLFMTCIDNWACVVFQICSINDPMWT